MLKKVSFSLESNVMTGGIRIADNFLSSESFISGAVLRAGYANKILLECNYSDIKAHGKSKSGKRNYICIEDDLCTSCPLYDTCERFSNMFFSFLLPDNCIPAPLTAKACKAHGTDHNIKDTVFCANETDCSICKDRTENIKGLLNFETLKSYQVRTNTSTHTAINYVSRTASESSLFSIKAIQKDQIYSGIIDDLGSGLLKIGDIVYVGKYSSSGFGKLKIISIDSYEPVSLENRLSQFNAKFKREAGKEYAAVLFVSNAKLGFDQEKMDEALTDLEYLNIWAAKIGLDPSIKLEQVWSHNTLYSGYDTSSEPGFWRKAPEIHTQMGTTLLISYAKNDSVALSNIQMLERNGIGMDTKNGYGQIEVCGKIHMIGAE